MFVYIGYKSFQISSKLSTTQMTQCISTQWKNKTGGNLAKILELSKMLLSSRVHFAL